MERRKCEDCLSSSQRPCEGKEAGAKLLLVPTTRDVLGVRLRLWPNRGDGSFGQRAVIEGGPSQGREGQPSSLYLLPELPPSVAVPFPLEYRPSLFDI